MDFVSLVLLAVGLAMDAFAVSICGSMVLTSESRTRGAVRFGLWFGGFQALMPVLGWAGGAYFRNYITNYDHWIAFVLLAYIGGNMIWEARESCVFPKACYSNKEMFTLAVATSIDALAVGISFAFLEVNIVWAAVIIGVITFAFAFIGGVFGVRIGEWGKAKAEVAGGLVLIFLGFKILAEHLGFI